MPAVGAILPVAVKLYDTDTAQVVRATMRDKAGAELTGSPYLLAHVGLGLYQIDTVAMPDTDFVTISHEIFKGPGFTNKNFKYQDASQCFIKDALDEAIETLLSASRKADITATISDESDIEAVLLDTDYLTAAISDASDVSAQVADDNALNAVVDDKLDLGAEIKDG